MALRIPSPKALTKPEAYLAYKAGIMSRDELKQSVYNPLNNYEGWLAKWCELLETYPTNEDGTPQCLTDEEGLLAYLCGVTDRYPATNSRPDDARISAYIRYLVSARYARPDHPLNREEFYLSLIKTQFIPSGNPSSDIVIDGTTKAPFVDVKAYGDTLQNSYSGKNLWNGEFGQGQTYSPTTTNRITTTQSPALRSGQTYTVSAFNLPSGFRYAVALFASPAYPGSNPGKAVFDSGWKTSESFTFTPSSDCYFAVVMSKTDNTSLTPSDVSSASYQLELGSTATDYEPYVGGIPAPNPDYPQPISVVTGENVVKVVGKNLANLPENTTLPTTTNPITVFDNGQDITVSSLVMTFIMQDAIYANAGGALIDFQKADGTHQYRTPPQIRDASNTQPPVNSAFSGTYYFRQTTSITFQKVNVYLGASYANWSQGTVSVQLELNTTDPTAYEPYQGQDFEVNLGKNLTSLTGQSNITWGNTNNNFKNFLNTLGVGTYTFSCKFTLTSRNDQTDASRYGFYFAYGGGNIIDRPEWGNVPVGTTKDYSLTFTVTEAQVGTFTNVYVYGCGISGATGSADASEFQVERGSSATSYSEYFTPIELAKIGTYQDRIYKDGEKWYVEKNVGKVVLDGSEDGWTFQASNAPFRYRLTGSYSTYDDASTFISDYFQSVAWNATWINYDYLMSPNSENNILVFRYTGISTLEDFKTWLGTHPTTVYYALATPTTTEITNQTLIDQLNALKQGGAEEGTTYIRVSATDPNLPAKLYVEAPKYD